MKKVITGMFAVCMLTLSASAQSKSEDMSKSDRAQSRAQQSNRMNPRLIDQLDLTVTQKDQIKVINDDYRSKMQEMIKSEIPAEDRKGKRDGFDLERRNKILEVLTPDQEKKLKVLQMNPGMNDKDDKQEYKEKIKVDGEKTKIKVKTD